MVSDHVGLGILRISSHPIDHPLRSVRVFSMDFRLSRGSVPTSAQVGASHD
jgi:hypothetical protein